MDAHSDKLKVYLDEKIASAEELALEDQFWNHYLTTVRRLTPGDKVQLAGPDVVANAEIISIDPLTFHLHSQRPASRPGYSLWLLQAVTRKKKIEASIKRGAELGITHFLPLYTKRTVRRPNNPSKQQSRWRKIALDSTRITGRDWSPKIFTPVELENFPENISDLDTIFFGTPAGKPPAESFTSSPSRSALLVGPEGGFTETEEEFITCQGACAVSLGEQNYRAETAALTLATLWLYHQNILPAQ